MGRKLTRLEKSTAIISNSIKSEWRYVNTENEFTFMNLKLVIHDSVEEYKVYNKAGTVEEYTNEAYMEQVLVVVSKTGDLKFYNQNYDYIEPQYVNIRI
ncbi:hypothetical protein PQE72_gp026 [Bacillus phage vB_BanS_Skywalker]|uniref:Uncharacterized protein n=2 Tax=Caudoviricetes TaxID=2731619 RepID=A0AAE9CEG4_9CAUD|nr:hypothetical protein PQE72_gp026 [Bacillus phage vB_BanS_Skywalker]UGO51204.1 hypothetical protein SKYWALKER_26 [Bacillus phage vB_BanS_Skywalker]